MANLIEEITNRLLLVNKTIPSKKAPEEIVFEDASVLAEFFAGSVTNRVGNLSLLE